MEKDKVKKDLYDILGQEIDVPNSFSNSILNFKYKKKKRLKMNFYRKVAIAFSFIVVSMSMVGYAFRISDIFKAESSIGYVDNSIKQAVDNGYIQNVEMDYLYSNNVGAKIDYVIMSDYNLNILFNFDISMKKNMQNTMAEITDLLIYDENNNIIYANDYKIYKKFCKRNSIEYNKQEIVQDSISLAWEQIELSSKINRIVYKFTSVKGFPKSEKIYIQFNTIYFDKEKSNPVNGKWNLQLNLREEFYKREEIKYQLVTQNNDIELLDASITDTSMRITYIMKNIESHNLSNISMYLEDNLGNRYRINNIENGISKFDKKISATFPIVIKDNFEYLILHISTNDKDYISIVLEPKK